jgi:hypothetical protein
MGATIGSRLSSSSAASIAEKGIIPDERQSLIKMS